MSRKVPGNKNKFLYLVGKIFSFRTRDEKWAAFGNNKNAWTKMPCVLLRVLNSPLQGAFKSKSLGFHG